MYDVQSITLNVFCILNSNVAPAFLTAHMSVLTLKVETHHVFVGLVCVLVWKISGLKEQSVCNGVTLL